MAQISPVSSRCLLVLFSTTWPATEAIGLAAKVQLLQHHVRDYNSTKPRNDVFGYTTWSLVEIGERGRNAGEQVEQLQASWHDATLFLLCGAANDCSHVESFRNPNDAWKPVDKATFLAIYFGLMACLCLLTHYWDRLPALIPKSTTGVNLRAPPCINTSKTSSNNSVHDPPETREISGAVVHGPTPAYNVEARVFDLFEAQVKERPRAIALDAPGDLAGVGARKRLTYEALAAAITETAATLTASGVARGQIAALILDRSIGQVVAVFAVMQSGAAFLPIAQDFPLARKRFLLAESEAAAVLGEPHDTVAAQLAAEENAAFIGVPDDGSLGHLQVSPPPVPKELKQSPPNPQNPASDLALLIYTSGTTGRPKGIVYDHRHLTHGVHFFAEHCQMDEASVGLLKSPYIWAIVEYELFPSLVRGGRLVVASPEGHKSPPYLANTIRGHDVSVLLVTPQVLDLVVDMHEAGGGAELPPLATLRHIVTVGEPLSSTLANRVVSTPGIQAELHNFYGASESSCTIYTVPSKGIDLEMSPKVVPAGKPQPHCSVYIMAVPVDGEGSHETPLRLVQRGGVGEICFGGVTAVRYWKHESLTAEKWVETEFGRLYRTGDMGRWSSGELEIVGRTDRQAKIRGVRIQPEEVEVVLRDYCKNGSGPVVNSVAVVATTEPAELVAFVSQRSASGAVTVDLLREHCKAQLAPAYVPKHFVLLPTLPQLPNEKLNLSELQDRANKYVSEEGEVVMDSLGQMRKLSRSALDDIPTIHRCYAFWMLGVLSDHFCRCAINAAPEGGWQPYCAVLASRQVPPWVEILVRTTGNDQDMFGFIMTSAYQDARRGGVGDKKSINFGMQDLYIALIYLAAALPIPQCLALVCRVWPLDWQGYPAPTSMWNASYMADSNIVCIHRWYLRMMLWSRAFLAVCESCGVPVWLQSLIVTAPLLVPVNEAVDFCDASTENNFVQFWVLGSCFAYLRWLQVFIAFYVLCFHWSETVVDHARALLPKGRTWGAVALSMSATIGTLMAMFHYPARELGSSLWWASLEIPVTIAQPALFIWGMAYVPFNLAWWGNSTLGTYIFHFYFRDQVSVLIIFLSEVLSFDRSGFLLLISIFLLYALFNTIVGPAFHYILVGLSRVGPIVVRIANWICPANREDK